MRILRLTPSVRYAPFKYPSVALNRTDVVRAVNRHRQLEAKCACLSPWDTFDVNPRVQDVLRSGRNPENQEPPFELEMSPLITEAPTSHKVPECSGVRWNCPLFDHEHCTFDLLRSKGVCIDRYRGIVECFTNTTNIAPPTARNETEQSQIATLYIREILRTHTCLESVDVEPKNLPSALSNPNIREIVVSCLGLPKKVPLNVSSPFREAIRLPENDESHHCEHGKYWPRCDECDPVSPHPNISLIERLKGIMTFLESRPDCGSVAVNFMQRTDSKSHTSPLEVLRGQAQVILDMMGHQDSESVCQYYMYKPQELFSTQGQINLVRHLFIDSRMVTCGWLEFFLEKHTKDLTVYIKDRSSDQCTYSRVMHCIKQYKMDSPDDSRRHKVIFMDPLNSYVNAAAAHVPDIMNNAALISKIPASCGPVEGAVAVHLTCHGTTDMVVKSFTSTESYGHRIEYLVSNECGMTGRTNMASEGMSSFLKKVKKLFSKEKQPNLRHVIIENCKSTVLAKVIVDGLRQLEGVQHVTLIQKDGPIADSFWRKYLSGLKTLTCLDVFFESKGITTNMFLTEESVVRLFDGLLSENPKLTCIRTNCYMSQKCDVIFTALLQKYSRQYCLNCNHQSRGLTNLSARTFLKWEQYLLQSELVTLDAREIPSLTYNNYQTCQWFALMPITMSAETEREPFERPLPENWLPRKPLRKVSMKERKGPSDVSFKCRPSLCNNTSLLHALP